MKRTLLVFILLILCFPAFAEDVSGTYKQLNAQYLKEISMGEYTSALSTAQSLNSIDPSDTQALLYIVFASIKAGKTIPGWVFEEPWSDRTDQDRFNRRLAEQLAKGT